MLFKLINNFSENQLYEFRKCEIINPLNENTKIEAILISYRDLEILAADMRCLCVSLQSTSSEKYYIREMSYAA